MILCGFEGCRGGNFSRPYRNFSPPPREFFPPPLWGDIIFHHRRPSALPKLIFKKINSGSGENYIPPPGGSSFGLLTALVFGNPVKNFYRVKYTLYKNLQGLVGCPQLYPCRTLTRRPRKKPPWVPGLRVFTLLADSLRR